MINKTLGLVNSPLGVIIPSVINQFFIIMMKVAFEQLPASYEESAKIDGAGKITILGKILVPMVKATIAVIVMFTSVMQWNSWFQAAIYLPARRDLWPLQLVLREVLIQNDTSKIISEVVNESEVLRRTDYTANLIQYCAIVVGTLPILCIYPFIQKYFVKGVTLGGIKG